MWGFPLRLTSHGMLQRLCVNPEAWVALKVSQHVQSTTSSWFSWPPKMIFFVFLIHNSLLWIYISGFHFFLSFSIHVQLERSGQKSHLVSIRVIKREIDGSFQTFFFFPTCWTCLSLGVFRLFFFKSSLCCLLLCPWMRHGGMKQSGLSMRCAVSNHEALTSFIIINRSKKLK